MSRERERLRLVERAGRVVRRPRRPAPSVRSDLVVQTSMYAWERELLAECAGRLLADLFAEGIDDGQDPEG